MSKIEYNYDFYDFSRSATNFTKIAIFRNSSNFRNFRFSLGPSTNFSLQI